MADTCHHTYKHESVKKCRHTCTIKPGLAPFVRTCLKFGSKVGPKQMFGLASKVGPALILTSKVMFGLKLEIVSLPNFTVIYIEHSVLDPP